MNEKPLLYIVLNSISFNYFEKVRKKALKGRAKERLVEKLGVGYEEDDGHRIMKVEPIELEDESGNPLRVTLYESNRREAVDQENEKVRRRKKIDTDVRPGTPTQDFLDKYFEPKVPIGNKRPIYNGWKIYPCGHSPIIGYSRERFEHSSLRDTVGLYHSLLQLRKNSSKINDYEYNRKISDLERFLERIKPNSHLIKPSTSPSNYRNISLTQDLDFVIGISKELE